LVTARARLFAKKNSNRNRRDGMRRKILDIGEMESQNIFARTRPDSIPWQRCIA